MLPQLADLFVAWACQQHHLGELVGLAEELRHPLDGGGVHQRCVRAAQDSMAGLADERPADAGPQDFRWLRAEGRPAEGQMHSVEHLVTQQDLPRAQGAAVRDGRHSPGKVKPLPRAGDLARLDVTGRGQGEGHAARRSILDRGQHPEIGGLPRLPVSSPRKTDPHPLVQVHARPHRMQVREAEAGGVTHADHHPSQSGVPRMSLILARYEAHVRAGAAAGNPTARSAGSGETQSWRAAGRRGVLGTYARTRPADLLASAPGASSAGTALWIRTCRYIPPRRAADMAGYARLRRGHTARERARRRRA
jgi:hypothetical protein